MPETTETIKSLCRELETFSSLAIPFAAFTGFDGFIDKIQRVVNHKQGQETVYFESIQDYAQHLARLAGRSGQVEIVTSKTKFGGNAPILANTLANLGVKGVCMGSLGWPSIHPLFRSMHSDVKCIAVGNPGESQALEFEDGKIILSELSAYKDYHWSAIREKIDLVNLHQKIHTCTLFALVDWANIPHATDIWKGFLTDVILPLGKKDKLFLFDLCDPSKKSRQEIEKVLDLMIEYSAYGKVTLGLNENEAVKIWLALTGGDVRGANVSIPSLKEIGSLLFQRMNVETLLIHPVDRVLLFQREGAIEIEGRVVTEPKVLTGGGDNLNAGYCLGRLLKLDIRQCMVLGMAASGAYIQNGISPTIHDVVSYLEKWANTRINELITENL